MRYVEHGICSEGAPAVAPRGPGGPLWLVGTEYSLADAVQALERGASPAELGLSQHQARLVLEYAERGGDA